MHPRVGELESVSIHKKALINNTEHHHVFITRSLFQSECDNFFILLVVLENLVPEKSLGIGIGKIWYRKNYWYRYRLTFWAPPHTGSNTRN